MYILSRNVMICTGAKEINGGLFCNTVFRVYLRSNEILKCNNRVAGAITPVVDTIAPDACNARPYGKNNN